MATVSPELVGLDIAALREEAYAEDATTPPAMADLILERYGPEFYLRLPYKQQRAMLRHFLSSGPWSLTGSRSQESLALRARVVVEEDRPRMRLTVGKGVWDRRWSECEGRETRDLTIADLDHLSELYRNRARTNLIYATALIKWRDLARRKKAKTLGDLEQAGVTLPGAEMFEEDC